MKKLVLLQSRSSSERLPFKSLLKIRNIPIVNFIYKRIKSKHYKITVLTSNDKSDDYLCWLLKKQKIDFYRGSLNNVKKRFLDYAKKNHDNDIVVRLTADNILVDKKIIIKSISQLIKKKKKYLYTNPKLSGLPNGISVETFRLKVLRENKNNSRLNLEHVTNDFEKTLENTVCYNNIKKNWANFDCTIDHLKQYVNLKNMFKNPDIGVTESWEKIIEKTSKYKNEFKKKIECQKILIKTLRKNQISHLIKLKICALKDETWKYGIKSQLNFFDNNSHKSDLHNLLFLGGILVGYTVLKKKIFIKKNKQKISFLHFDTFVIKKKYRGLNYGQILMSYNNNLIINKNLPSFLICNNKLKQFYTAHYWNFLPRSKYEISRKTSKLNLMLFNANASLLSYCEKPKSKLFIDLF